MPASPSKQTDCMSIRQHGSIAQPYFHSNKAVTKKSCLWTLGLSLALSCGKAKSPGCGKSFFFEGPQCRQCGINGPLLRIVTLQTTCCLWQAESKIRDWPKHVLSQESELHPNRKHVYNSSVQVLFCGALSLWSHGTVRTPQPNVAAELFASLTCA